MLTAAGKFGAALLVGASLALPGSAAEPPDYRRDVLPVLARHCFACHSGENQESGLRLDVRDRALLGGDGGPALRPGDSRNSELIRRIKSQDEEERMPPDGPSLTPGEIALLSRWIDAGADGMPATGFDARQQNHWAFQPIQTFPAAGVTETTPWVRNRIDQYVWSKLQTERFRPAPEANRGVLARRLWLDLLGTVPPWERVQAFLQDTRPNAYEDLVDELLASPQYGERWGRHWLDLARYADSTGYEADTPRQIWMYREWVIEALNQDMTFDQFVIEQLAGDLLADRGLKQRIATGFQCNAMYDPGVRPEAILDRVNTIGSVFLGITTGCAQCHSHKTDPLTQREFYRLYAFFNEAVMTEVGLDGQPVPSDKKPDTSKPEPTTLVLTAAPQPTHLFVRGDPASPGELVKPGLPGIWRASPTSDRDLNRRDLADWLLHSDNPLTARVTANRVWQRFFGVGLVPTSEDFGTQTARPLQAELLDYLSGVLFRAGKWKGLKTLQREIVLSATYRQSSINAVARDSDPENHFLARQRRLRLEAEAIRDVSLTAAGLLSNRIGGPSVFPPQVEGVLNNRATPATWTPSSGGDRYRRGLYTWVWRLTPHPNLSVFDAPDGVSACVQRDRSNVPLQALTMLNDQTFVEAARGVARRIDRAACGSTEDGLKFAFRICLSRDPAEAEMALLQRLFAAERQQLTEQQALLSELGGAYQPHHLSSEEYAAWVIVSRVLINLDEFITRE